MAPNKEMIDAFVDGGLSAADHELMVHHISSCTECAAAVIAALAEAARALAVESSERNAGSFPISGLSSGETAAPAQDLLQLDLILDRSSGESRDLLLRPEQVREVHLDELAVTRPVESAADVRPPPPVAQIAVPEEVSELDVTAIAGLTAAGIAQSVAHAVAVLAEEEVSSADYPERPSPSESAAPTSRLAADEQPPSRSEKVMPVAEADEGSTPVAPATAMPDVAVADARATPTAEDPRETAEGPAVEEVPVVASAEIPADVELPVTVNAEIPADVELPVTVNAETPTDVEPLLRVDAETPANAEVEAQAEEAAEMETAPIAVVDEGVGGFRVTGVAGMPPEPQPTEEAGVSPLATPQPESIAPTLTLHEPGQAETDTIPEDERAILREAARLSAEPQPQPGRGWSFVVTATAALVVFAALASYAAVQLRGYATLENAGPPPVPVHSAEPAERAVVSVLAPVLDSAVYSSVIGDALPSDSMPAADSLGAVAEVDTQQAAPPDAAVDSRQPPAAASTGAVGAAGATQRPPAARAPAAKTRPRVSAPAGGLPRILRTTTHRPRPDVDYVLREYDATGPFPPARPGVTEYRWSDPAAERLYVLSGRATVEELRAFARRLQNGRSQ